MNDTHDLHMTRELDAPRTRVFHAWADARELAQWWGPYGFTTPVCEVDARSGGSLYLEMRGPAGSDYEGPFPMWGTFVEVIPAERIVFSSMLKNGAGEVFLEALNTIALAERDGGTTLVLDVRVVSAGPEAAGPLAGMADGWSQTLDRLQTFVAAS